MDNVGHTADRVLTRLPAASVRRHLSQQVGLREVMAQFATGITVLTAGGERGHGMTANAFTSVSLEPPMVLCCVSRAARMHAAITHSGHFAVNVLGADQQETARYFADWRRPAGAGQFSTIAHTPGRETGAPLITGALAWLECELVDAHDGGDHAIFVGRVLASIRGTGEEALVFYGGDYHHIGQNRATA